MPKQRKKTPVVSIEEIKKLLEAGYTRYAKDDHGVGSIEAYYEFDTTSAVKDLFKNTPELKRLQTKTPKYYILERMQEHISEETFERQENKKKERPKEKENS